MMTIYKRHIYSLLIMGIGGLASSCSTAEDPAIDDCYSDDHKTHVQVLVNVSNSFKDFANLDADDISSGQDTRSEDGWRLRYTLMAFSSDDSEMKSPIYSVNSCTPKFDFNLPLGKYRIAVWADYVDSDTEISKYFHTDDFSDMLLINKFSYKGDDSYKMAFGGNANLSVTYQPATVAIDLQPLMGQYRLIASDSPDYSVGKIVVSYPEGLPSSYDFTSDSIVYFWSGVSFTASTSGMLAFDNVFANSNATNVGVRIDIYDEQGNLKANRKLLNIPIVRGGLTTVTGKFYTIKESDGTGSDTGGGAGIKSDFDDTFFIEVTQ